MTQKFSFWEDLSIRENLESVARMYALEDGRAKVDDTRLRGLLPRSASNSLQANFSGGWKQRLALAACMLHSPKLLLLDEPTAGVDPKARRDFWDEIHRLSAEGLTVLVSTPTQPMHEAERCDRIVYINLGNIIAARHGRGMIAQSKLSSPSSSKAKARGIRRETAWPEGHRIRSRSFWCRPCFTPAPAIAAH